MSRASRANPPPLHRAIGKAAACGLALDSHYDRQWRHPRLPDHARAFWHGQRVIWATVITEGVTCETCCGVPK